MTTTANAAVSIETTTSLLQAELPQLEEHQQALQEQLAAVSERLESVRGALTALSALSATTVPHPRTAEGEARVPAEAETASVEADTGTTPEPAETTTEAAPTEIPSAAPEETATPRRARKAGAGTKQKAASRADEKPVATRRPAKKPTAAKATKAKQTESTAPAEAVLDAGGLTEQVIAVLARDAGTPLRARDVAQVLGRDDSAGDINTVRSTLDRLVATSRAHRAGRGLYQAPAN
ncbi:hypothetical protein ACFU5O_30870 [Streptomyces sp. NPDC057445]|uniref:hypothetical protein n=1 Tax=Streptomyces sp. NPDC057445 TaxID=3346136 RepID=UPI0036899456